jgi:hypothetical protein
MDVRRRVGLNVRRFRAERGFSQEELAFGYIVTKRTFWKGPIAMQPSIFSSFQPRPSPKATIPYTSAALRQDLERLRGTWEDCQASRDRNAIYGYLTAVYGWWHGGWRKGVHPTGLAGRYACTG